MEVQQITDPRPAFTVDFGDVLHGRILEASKRTGIPKSQLVRDAVSYFLDNLCDDKYIEKNSKRNQVKTNKRDEVFRLVSTYEEVFYCNTTPPNQFYPALYKTYNAAVKGGLTTDDMVELIKAAPNETFVANDMKNGKKPSLPYLLSSGMIPRLMVAKQELDAKQSKLSESEFYEYKLDVLESHIPEIPFTKVDEFRDILMNECNTRQQVISTCKEFAGEYIS